MLVVTLINTFWWLPPLEMQKMAEKYPNKKKKSRSNKWLPVKPWRKYLGTIPVSHHSREAILPFPSSVIEGNILPRDGQYLALGREKLYRLVTHGWHLWRHKWVTHLQDRTFLGESREFRFGGSYSSMCWRVLMLIRFSKHLHTVHRAPRTADKSWSGFFYKWNHANRHLIVNLQWFHHIRFIFKKIIMELIYWSLLHIYFIRRLISPF